MFHGSRMLKREGWSSGGIPSLETCQGFALGQRWESMRSLCEWCPAGWESSLTCFGDAVLRDACLLSGLSLGVSQCFFGC